MLEAVMTHPTLESLVSDIEALAQRAETLLGETAGEVEEGILERSEAALAAARARLQALDNAIRARARGIDRAVQSHPWTAVGIGAAVGLLLGFLVGRRER